MLLLGTERNGTERVKERGGLPTKGSAHAMPVGNPKSDRDCLCRDKDNRIANLATAFFLYVKAPRGGERPDRPRRPEKFGRPIAIRWLRMKENLAISEY